MRGTPGFCPNFPILSRTLDSGNFLVSLLIRDFCDTGSSKIGTFGSCRQTSFFATTLGWLISFPRKLLLKWGHHLPISSFLWIYGNMMLIHKYVLIIVQIYFSVMVSFGFLVTVLRMHAPWSFSLSQARS